MVATPRRGRFVVGESLIKVRDEEKFYAEGAEEVEELIKKIK